MKKIILSITLFLLSSCGAARPHPHPPADTPRCPDACVHLRALGCEEGKPLEDGTSCESFCESTQTSGHALNPTCVIVITKCSDMDDLGSFCKAKGL